MELQTMQNMAQEVDNVEAENLTEPNQPDKADAPKEPKEALETTLTKLLRENKDIQSEFDQRISKALQTARAKWEKEASMTEEERVSQALKDREEAIAKREEAQEQRERFSTALDLLRSAHLPEELADIVSLSHPDEMKPLVDSIKGFWDDQMTEQLKATAKQIPAAASDGYRAGSDASPFRSLQEFATKNRKVK